MDKEYLISLCIPTNGIIEWVMPVLESIYNQGINTDLFEVVLTNNGNNEDFHYQMLKFKEEHMNMLYKRTTAVSFENQLDAIELAHGQYLKFVNHRFALEKGTLEKLIQFVRENKTDKPICYFSNGAIGFKEPYNIRSYSTFDQFVRELKRYASWTTGVGIWKEDYERIDKPIVYDKISPHSSLLFSERKRGKYIIDDNFYFHEIDKDQSKKGKYDLFRAFAVEEITITLKLFLDHDISNGTFQIVKKDYKKMVIGLYRDFCILKRPCSYILDGFDESMGIFMKKPEIVFKAWISLLTVGLRKIVSALHR